jgi:predicted DNA-binding protein
MEKREGISMTLEMEVVNRKLKLLLKNSSKHGPEHDAFYFLYDGIESIISEIEDKKLEEQWDKETKEGYWHTKSFDQWKKEKRL